MKVKWTWERPLHTIPEEYWGEDLTKLDKHYQGEVIGTTKSFWGTTYLTVMCDDGQVREVEINKVKQIKDGKKD